MTDIISLSYNSQNDIVITYNRNYRSEDGKINENQTAEVIIADIAGLREALDAAIANAQSKFPV